MTSESARMSSAEEARFRIQAPNSTPRSTKVIALDAAGEAVIRRLSASSWPHTTFMSTVRRGVRHDGLDTVFRDPSGHPRDLAEEITMADLVVMVAGPGGHAHAAPLVGRECSRQSVMTTALVVGADAAADSALSQTLAQVRPWSLMVVIAKGDEYIDDMMTALRA